MPDYQATVRAELERWRAAAGNPPPRRDTTGRIAQLNIAVNQLAQHGQWHEIRDLLFAGADFLAVLSLALRNIHLAPEPDRSDALEGHLVVARENADRAYNGLCDVLKDLSRTDGGMEPPSEARSAGG